MASSVDRILSRIPSSSPAREIGIDGFKLFSRIRENINYQAEIPISFVESGSALNDHIIKQPVTLKIQGNVGDVFIDKPGPLTGLIGSALNEIGNITQYLPAKTQTQISKAAGLANDIADAARRAEALIRSGEQVLNLFGNNSEEANPLGKQFLDKMELLFETGQIIDVDMPHKVYKNMAITNISIERNNESSSLDFSIDFQRFQQVEVEFLIVAKNPGAGTGGAIEGKKDKGPQKPEKVTESFLSILIGND